jgi:hypothetical protein
MAGYPKVIHFNRKLRTWAPRCSRCLLSPKLSLFSRRLQLPVAFRVDRLLPPRQHGLRSDVARGAVQAEVSDVSHTRDSNELLDVLSNGLWPVVRACT